MTTDTRKILCYDPKLICLDGFHNDLTPTECGISLHFCFERFPGGRCAELIVVCPTKAK